MKRLAIPLALLPLALAACVSHPCAPVRHGREPLAGIWWMKGGDDPAWARPELDEADPEAGWRVVDVPGGLRDYLPRDAESAWLRVRFGAPEASATGDFVLVLGRVDGGGVAFLNGAPLAGSGGTPRAYPVPQGMLQPQNVLALRVAGWEDEGGIVEGPVALMGKAEWARRAAAGAAPAPLRKIAGPHARAAYDPNLHRLTAFATMGASEQVLLDDVHFILRTRVREYDLSRIPEAEIETLPGDKGVRTLHVLEGEGVRFEAWYVLPEACGWPVLAVVGEASGGRDPVDIDLVYHAAAPGVVGAGGLREEAVGRRQWAVGGGQSAGPSVAWGRIFVHAPEGEKTEMPESVRKHNHPEGAFELLERETAGISGLPYPLEATPGQGETMVRLSKLAELKADPPGNRFLTMDNDLWEEECRKSLENFRVTLELEDASLAEVVDFLREFSMQNVVVDPDFSVDGGPKITYRAQNRPLSKVFEELAGASGWYVDDRVIVFTSAARAREHRERQARERSVREVRLATPVSSGGRSLTACLDALRRFNGLPIVPDRAVWEEGKRVVVEAEGEPLKGFLDRAMARLGGRWVYREGTIYLFKPTS